MTPDRWPLLKSLFDQARQRPPEERAAFLAEACPDDADLRAEVEQLLDADSEAAAFFDTLGREIRGAAQGEGLPERVGAWRVLREIGQGGMGQVLLAERADGQYAQRAAVKLVHAGLGPDLVARFRTERQILADLDHPGIARLIDGGVADDGRPFLVMEYVEGETITEYADRHRLTVSERLRLFRQAGDAVAYAHRRLVVHRDIKPSNVLVASDGGPGGGPAVKLLDFGIAKLLEDGAAAEVTRDDGRMLTPAYAAPEQLRGEPVTTGTDVYSLGVLLYELLTGHRPSRPPTADRAAAERAVLEQEPSEPSAAVGRTTEHRRRDGSVEVVTPAAVSEARRTAPERLRRRLRGDLDRIVLKALRKEPDQRYGTAEAFTRDVERHLRGLPVEARPASVAYRARSFVRRHRTGVAVAAAAVVLAAAFGALYTLRVARERDIAEAERDRAERITSFFTDMLAPAGDPETDTRAWMGLLEPAVGRAGSELSDDPRALAAVYHTLGALYRRAGRPDRALPLLRRALALRRAVAAGPSAEVAESLHALGAHFVGRDNDSAAAYFRAATQTRRALAAGDDGDLALSLMQWDRVLPHGHAEKGRRYEEAIAMLRRLHGPRSQEVANAMHEYYVLGFTDASDEEVEAAFREVLDIYRETGTEESATAVHAMHNMGLMLDRPGSREEALELLRRSVETARRTLPAGAPTRITMAVNYGATLSERGRLAEAHAVLAAAADEARLVLPDSASQVAFTHYWLGINLTAMGRPAEAEAALRTSLDIYRRVGPNGAGRYRAQVELAAALHRRGDRAAAEELLRAALEEARGTPSEEFVEGRLDALLARGGG